MWVGFYENTWKPKTTLFHKVRCKNSFSNDVFHILDGYNAENMQYKWENRTDKGVAVNEKLDDMPQYNMTGATTNSYFTVYYSGRSNVIARRLSLFMKGFSFKEST